MQVILLFCIIIIATLGYMIIRERQRTNQVQRDRQAVLNNINTAFIYLDTNYVVQWKSNRVVGEIISRVERYTVGKHCYETVKNRTSPCPNCPITLMMQKEDFVNHMDHDDGYLVEIKAFPARNNRGNIIGGVLQMADITQQVEQEEQLVKMNERFQFSLMGANIFAWELDLGTKTITGVVKGNSSQLYELDEYVQTLVHPDFQEALYKKLNQIFDHTSDSFEINVRSLTFLTGMKDYEWMYITGKAMLPDSQGRNTKLFGIQRIITEDKKRQIELEEAYSQQALMFEASRVSPWTIDLETERFDSTNQNVIEASGLTVDEIMQYIHEDDRETLRICVDKVILGESKSLYLQLRCFLPEDGGKENWYEMSGLVFKYNNKTGAPTRLIGIRRNIMYLKHTDELIELRNQAEASNRMKSAFLANMSHEIRTPLNAIVGFSQIILDESDNKKELNDYYKVIESNSDLLLQLINDILDLSRIEAGQIEMSYANFNVDTIFQNLNKVYSLKVGDDVDLIMQLPEQSCRIYSDQKRLTQVVSNFVNNACKYTSEGSITMGFAYTETGLRFFVKDTGKGMAQEDLPAVFERFTKFDAFVQGVGLGLSICKSIVENLDGEIGVESELGKGSEFWFTIPCEYEIINPADTTVESISTGHISNS